MRKRSEIRRTLACAVALCAYGSIGCGDESPVPRPTHGARIAEPDIGRWIWMCSVSVVGPERIGIDVQGKGVSSTRDLARTAAIKDACAAVDGGVTCQNATSGWTLGAAHCKETKEQPVTFECTIDASRKAGRPEANQQAEAPSAERACRRARREACRKVAGGVDCARGTQGWRSQKSLARRR